jgi:branched-chain amino acid transport system permease protein
VKRLTNFDGKKAKTVAVVVLAIVLLALPLIIENDYIKHLLIMTCIGAILGMTFSLLFSTGLISLGAAAFYAVGAYVSAVLSMNFGFSFWAAFPVTIVVSSLLAAGVGAIFVRNGGIAFAIITLLFANAVVIAAGQIEYLGGWGGIIGVPRPTALGPIEFANKTSYYYLALAILTLVVLAFYALYTSRVGRAWKAIKLSPHLSGTLGINLYRYRLLAFVVAAAAASAAGCFYAHYFQTVTPGAFGGWLSIYIQLYSVLGGLEYYLLGPVIGTIVMTFIPEYLRVIKEYEPIVTGVLLLVIILFFPGGILGSLLNSERLRGAGFQDRIRKIGTWLKKSG